MNDNLMYKFIVILSCIIIVMIIGLKDAHDELQKRDFIIQQQNMQLINMQYESPSLQYIRPSIKYRSQ